MTIGGIVAIALGIAAVFGSVRALHDGRRNRATRIALQLAAAGLLYACLFPPTTHESFLANELTVLTPGATTQQLDALGAAATVVALPGVDAARGIERAPDLGTALRRHPQSRQLRVVGGGLPARDRDAARGLVARFDAAPLPRGLVELDAPAAVRAGSVWRLGGRVVGVADGRVELRDPAGAVVDGAAFGSDGRFALSAPAKAAGAALFALHVRGRDGQSVDEVPVPLVARAGEPLRVLLLAGAPDPELKYLRRWAVDAGVRLDSRLALTEGVALTEGAVALDAAAFAQADLVLIDERAWAALDRAQKQALRAAVRAGLGLLLRVTGPLPAPVAAEWSALGFALHARDPLPAVALDHALGLPDSGLVFARRAIDVQADGATALLRADDGAALALWRADGQGRIGLWWLADSWRLALGGERARYATLWSDTLAALARARGTSVPTLPRDPRVDERAVLCGLAADAAIETPSGERAALVIEHTAVQSACAAYWPAQSGWHTLVSGGSRWPLRVRAADEARALAGAENARATRALVGGATAPADIATRPIPRPRWPFFLAWLAAMTLLWVIERRGARAAQM